MDSIKLPLIALFLSCVIGVASTVAGITAVAHFVLYIADKPISTWFSTLYIWCLCGRVGSVFGIVSCFLIGLLSDTRK